MQQLLIIKSIDLVQRPEYALLGKEQLQDTFTQADWKEIKSLTKGRKVVILLDASEVILTSVNIPSTNKKQLIKAVPYALEDTLAEDIEDLHFAVHQDTKSEDNVSQVAVINRDALTDTLDIVRSHGITVTYAISELLTQRIDDDAWSIIYEKQENTIAANVRLDKFNGFVCDFEMLDVFIPDAEDEQPSQIFSNTKSQNFPKSIRTITANAINPDTIEFGDIEDSLELNLRSNLVYSNQQNSSKAFKNWKPIAILGGVIASVWLGTTFWQNLSLQKQNDQLTAQINKVFTDTFPDKKPTAVVSRMKQELDKLRAQKGQTVGSPLPLIADIAPLLKEYKDLPLSNLRYQENQLSMTLESPSLTRLDSFKKAAADKRKLNVEITDSTTTANNVKATIKVTALKQQGNS